MSRMLHIHQTLLDGRYPNCSTLCRTIEVSSKTIQRDLDYMRDQLDLPIEYDKTRHGYCYTESVIHFPTIPTTEGEVLALFVAQKALEQYRGTPFEQPLATAFGKLAQILEEEISINFGELSQALSFRHTGVAITDLATFKQVTRALQESRELTFSYRKLNQSRSQSRHVQPYHLSSIDGQWYLFANDLDRHAMRTFVLGRIQDKPAVGRKFKKDPGFSLSERLMGSFGVFSGTGDYKVTIEFDAFAAQLVRERKWHDSQVLQEVADDRLLLTLQLDSLEEIERWVLGWGGHAKVLTPPALKKQVRAALKEMQDNYAGVQPWLADLYEAAHANQPDRVLQMVLTMDQKLESPGQMSLGLDRPKPVAGK